ncbi:MAG: peptidoglycan editing factor PgeF [Thermomicrobiales bacterium]|nr:MAG: peptidoglycan editing factor PgeF [Thermomicrobiales bacterium]
MTIPRDIKPLQGTQISRLPFVRHGITRRVPGLGDADGNISYSEPRDPVDAWQMRQYWCDRIGVDPASLVTAHQVHGNGVGVVPQGKAGTGSAPGTGLFGKYDSLVTNDPNVAVMMTHADCLAVVLCDPQVRAVGVVHAGWRGTVSNVSGAAVAAMVEAFGSAPEETLAFIGPGICAACYAVGDEVADSWSELGVPQGEIAVSKPNGQWHFDLAEANRLQLRAAGLREDAIERSGVCTRCGGPTWFSHRGQGPATGRFASIIAVVE